ALGGALTSISGSAVQTIFGVAGGGMSGYTRELVLTLAQTEDWYAIDLPSTGNTVRLETSTPADGPNQFVNTLNPHIELYDPTGTAFDAYPLGVTVTDNHGTSGSSTTSVTVNNVAPAVTSLTPPSSINESDTYTLAGTFHDDGTLDTHTVVIAWGPGEGSTT